MASAPRRFSFDDDEEASFQPHHPPQPDDHYYSARPPAASSYQVSSGAAYFPPREPSVSPDPYDHSPPGRRPRFLSDAADQEQRQPSFDSYNPYSQQSYMDSSPPRQQVPPPPMHRDPHAINVPIPPPHTHHRSGSSDASGRHPAALMAAGTSATAAAATTAFHADTGYHGRSGSDPFDSYSERDSLNTTGHGYPAYTTTSQDPFATPRMSAQNIASNSYEMRPPSSTKRTTSFDPYGGRAWHESERDLGSINPHDIADDDDEGIVTHKGRATLGAGAAAAAGAGGILGGVMGKRDQSGNYGQVPGGEPEKSTWLQKQTASNKRWKWIVGSLIGAIVVLAVIGGIIGGVIVSKKGASSSSSSSNSNLLDANSPQVKALLNNQNLHKIFPGMDYTPQNAAQWPDCLVEKPLQNNVTMDVAVMSQLTPAIRLYGTDCNQTEMVLDAIDRLNLNNSMKVWMGVYVMDNQTTNTRQLDQMWTLLDTYGAEPFAGVIVGNEVLLNGAMSDQDLANMLNSVRSNMTAHGWNLTVSTSDAGVSFSKNPATTKATDIVMANVHPFFAGVAIAQAASWTWTYTQTNDHDPGKETLIAETGWPAGGGNYCTNSSGLQTACASSTSGAVASMDNVNKFLGDWACQALANGTRYFMFEAFDEAWKAEYNKPGETWETQWGLFDENRNEKTGLQIPDCGGKTATG